MSSSVGANSNEPAASSRLDLVERAEHGVAARPARAARPAARPPTWAREPAMSSRHSRRSNGQADGVRQQGVGRAAGEAPVPERRSARRQASSPAEAGERPQPARRASLARRRRGRRRTAACRRRRRCRAARRARCGRAPTRRRGRSRAACAGSTRLAGDGAPRRPTPPAPGAAGRTGPAGRSPARAGRRRSARPGTRTLIAPSSSRSRDTVACVAVIPSPASSSRSCGWLATARWPISRAIVCWRCCLAHAPSAIAARRHCGGPDGTSRAAQEGERPRASAGGCGPAGTRRCAGRR